MNGCDKTSHVRNAHCPRVFRTERWLGWGDWPKILYESIGVWRGEELWVSDTGDYQRSKSVMDFMCNCLYSLYLHLSSLLSTPAVSFGRIFFIPISLLASPPPFFLCLSYSVSLYHLRNLISWSCFLFLYSSDAGGRVHTVCHDSGDQAELDRGVKEEHSTQQLSRPHTVITSRSVPHWNFVI